MRKLLMISALCLSTLPAFAQTDTAPATSAAPATGALKAMHDQCRSTVESLCPGVKPGQGRIEACLKQQGKTMKDVCPQKSAMRKQDKQEGLLPQHGGSGQTGAPVAQPPSTQD